MVESLFKINDGGEVFLSRGESPQSEEGVRRSSSWLSSWSISGVAKISLCLNLGSASSDCCLPADPTGDIFAVKVEWW